MTVKERREFTKRAGAYVMQARWAAHMGVGEFARAIGVSEKTYEAYVDSAQRPMLGRLFRIERISGLSLDAMDKRIWQSIRFLERCHAAVEEGAFKKKIRRGLGISEGSFRKCIRFIHSYKQGRISLEKCPLLTETIIKIADKAGAMNEAEIEELFGAISESAYTARTWIGATFGPEIQETAREIAPGRFEFFTDALYRCELDVDGRRGRFRAFFKKDGNETLSIDREVKIA